MLKIENPSCGKPNLFLQMILLKPNHRAIDTNFTKFSSWNIQYFMCWVNFFFFEEVQIIFQGCLKSF